MKAKEWCESLMTEVAGRISSGLVGLHMKGLLLGMSLGTGQQDPRISKHQNIENKSMINEQREGAAFPRLRQESWNRTGGWKSPSQWEMADSKI